MAIFLQYNVCLMLLVELPARNLLCTCVMRAFNAFTETAGTELTKLYVQQRKILKMFNVFEINLLSEFQFNLKCCSNIVIRILMYTQYRDTYRIVS